MLNKLVEEGFTQREMLSVLNLRVHGTYGNLAIIKK